MVIMVLVDHERSVPSAEGAPVQGAGLTGHADQLKCPFRVRFIGNISGNRIVPNGYRQAPDLGHYVKRDEEVEKKGAHARFPPNRLFACFAACLDILVIKRVEDFKILFEACADVCPDDGRVQDALLKTGTCVYVAIKLIGGQERILSSRALPIWPLNSRVKLVIGTAITASDSIRDRLVANKYPRLPD
jgi:hypothetical protein